MQNAECKIQNYFIVIARAVRLVAIFFFLVLQTPTLITAQTRIGVIGVIGGALTFYS